MDAKFIKHIKELRGQGWNIDWYHIEKEEVLLTKGQKRIYVTMKNKQITEEDIPQDVAVLPSLL